jgi:hypothetical protein
VKFHDDITQRNLGLMARLKNTEKFENVWFYNCNVKKKRIKTTQLLLLLIFVVVDFKQ